MKRSISALAAAVVCAGACAGAATARTANTSAATQECSKVSASSVSAIVGYKLPAATGEIITEKATKKNFGIAFQTLDCTFGVETSLAGLKKAVSVSIETLSRSLTSSELKKLVTSQLLKAAGLKVVPYSGLGGTSFYMTASAGGIHIESIATGTGTKLYGATVESNLSKSKLASLVKLAQNL
jgi:hypothetical protein